MDATIYRRHLERTGAQRARTSSTGRIDAYDTCHRRSAQARTAGADPRCNDRATTWSKLRARHSDNLTTPPPYPQGGIRFFGSFFLGTDRKDPEISLVNAFRDK